MLCVVVMLLSTQGHHVVVLCSRHEGLTLLFLCVSMLLLCVVDRELMTNPEQEVCET